MLEMIEYVVTETREVKVVANCAVDAARIADAVFENGQNLSEPTVLIGKGPEAVWGNSRSRVRQTEITVREGR